MKALVILCLLATGAEAAQGDVLAELERAEVKLFDRAAPSVVFISSHGSFGSGFFVGGGLILTAAHVVTADRVDLVLFDGRRLAAHVVERAENTDLALLEVDAIGRTPLPHPLPLEPEAPRVGSFVGAVGHGRGGIWSFNVGIVSNLYPTQVMDTDDGRGGVFQTQIPLYPGSSGGPIVDSRGRVVGVVTAGLADSPGINFALRIDRAARTLHRLSETVAVLTVLAPKDARLFLDGALVATGPRATLLPTPGEHDLSAVVDGAGITRRHFQFPAEREIDLARRPVAPPKESP